MYALHGRPGIEALYSACIDYTGVPRQEQAVLQQQEAELLTAAREAQLKQTEIEAQVLPLELEVTKATEAIELMEYVLEYECTPDGNDWPGRCQCCRYCGGPSHETCLADCSCQFGLADLSVSCQTGGRCLACDRHDQTRAFHADELVRMIPQGNGAADHLRWLGEGRTLNMVMETDHAEAARLLQLYNRSMRLRLRLAEQTNSNATALIVRPQGTMVVVAPPAPAQPVQAVGLQCPLSDKLKDCYVGTRPEKVRNIANWICAYLIDSEPAARQVVDFFANNSTTRAIFSDAIKMVSSAHGDRPIKRVKKVFSWGPTVAPPAAAPVGLSPMPVDLSSNVTVEEVD